MRPIGPNGGRDYDRQRRPDAELHAQRLGHVDNPEDFKQNRDDDGAAANAEQSGEEAGDDSGDRQPDQFAKGCSEVYSAASLIDGAGVPTPVGRSNSSAGSRSK